MIDRIGKYQLEEQIGVGSTGVVYRGYQADLDRPVALKRLAPALVNRPEFLSRLRTEAHTMARLVHPNCVTIYDYLESPDGVFLVMEYVPGASLRIVLRQAHRLSAEQSLLVLRGCLSGLGHAHGFGLVHRDIKPENILVDPGGVSKLADFGLSIDAGGKDRQLLGTPTYMSPEQARGDTLDPRTDLYSAGVVLFELLAGHPPFAGEGPATVLAKHLSAPPPSLPRVPGVLEKLVQRALAKDPAARPQSAEEFLLELEHAARRGYGAGWADRGSVVALVGGVLTAGALVAGTSGASSTAVVAGTEVAGTTVGGTSLGASAAGPISASAVHPVTVTVQPGDTLWDLARRYLGNPDRYQEIWNLNRGKIMPDGQPFSSPDLIQPGLVLTLPADAAVDKPLSKAMSAIPRKAWRFASGHRVAAVAAVVIPVVAASILTVGAQEPGAKGNVPPVGHTTTTHVQPSLRTIPDGLVGSPWNLAVSRLKAAGYTHVREQSRPDANAPSGTVLAVVPASGTKWPAAAEVTLDVSSGIHITQPPSLILVPNVIGEPAQTAASTLQKAGFTFNMIPQHSSTVPAGTVISQAPGAGTFEPPNTAVQLMVSSGPPGKPANLVPDVVGRSQASAEAAISTAGFAVNTSTAVSNQPAGTVISQTPTAGASEPAGATVSIVVSRGPSPCPSVIGDSLPMAVAALQAAGCPTASERQYSTAPVDQVIGQSPSPPEPKGTTVVLVVSQGPAPCPDVAGQPAPTAERTLTAAGCQVTETTAYSSTVPSGDVISENPPPPQPSGTAISIVVSLGQEPVVPNVIGQQQAAAEAAIKAAGFTYKVTTEISPGPSGIVLRQTPSGGTSEPPGTNVELVISTVQLVPVPSVTGDLLSDAENALTKVGLTYKVITTSDYGCNVVELQDPAGGTPVPLGSTVTLTVADGYCDS
jgi:serine/threonine-protein kinase